MGWLYNMPDHCVAVKVTPVADALQQPWFAEAMRHAARVDALVVLAHMDLADPLVSVLLKAIRREVGPDVPVQFLTGHSHISAWNRLDARASSFEAGHYGDTVGFAAFRGVLDTVTPLKIAIAANLVNVVLDPILIFNAGLGVAGAALATAASQIFAAAAYISLLLRRDQIRRLRGANCRVAPERGSCRRACGADGARGREIERERGGREQGDEHFS